MFPLAHVGLSNVFDVWQLLSAWGKCLGCSLVAPAPAPSFLRSPFPKRRLSPFPYHHSPYTLFFLSMKFLSTFVLLATLSTFAEAASFNHNHVHRSNHNGISRRANGTRCKQRPVRITRDPDIADSN